MLTGASSCSQGDGPRTAEHTAKCLALDVVERVADVAAVADEAILVAGDPAEHAQFEQGAAYRDEFTARAACSA